MLKIDLAKIDKFYVVWTVVLVLLSSVMVFAANRIFSSYDAASEINQDNISNELKINNDKLNQASEWIFDRQTVLLQVNLLTD